MPENKTKPTVLNAEFYKNEANRFKKIFQIQRLQTDEVPMKQAVNPFLCLSCMWVESCNGICIGGCEEYEQRMSAVQ